MAHKKISKKELDKGTRIEMEHMGTIKKYMKKGVSIRTIARSIARDHLSKEGADYYKELQKMEKKLKK